MAENFDGIWELRLFYTTTPTGFPTVEHRMTIDVFVKGGPEAGTPFSAIDVQNRDTSIGDLETTVDALIALLIPFYPSTSEFSRAELWSIPEGTYDGTFISSYEIAVVGTGAGTNTVAHQTTFTFRTLTGGNGRLQLMESIDSSNIRQTAPYTGRALNLTNFIIAATSPFLGRDNQAFFSNIAYSQGQNERLFRKRYRS